MPPLGWQRVLTRLATRVWLDVCRMETVIRPDRCWPERLRRRVLPSLLLVALLIPEPARPQEIRGRVVDDATDGPVAGVLLVLLSGANPVSHGVSNEDGSFALRSDAPGLYALQATRLGYERTVVSGLELQAGGDPMEFDLLLVPRPVALEGLTVTAPRYQGDVERFGLSLGDLGRRVVTRDVLDGMGVAEVADIIERSAPPGFDVMRAENVAEVLGGSLVTNRFPLCVRLSRARAADGTTRCALVVLDQSIVAQQVAEGLGPTDLEAVIFLTPTEAVQIYGTMGGAGAVLLYTRRGR